MIAFAKRRNIILKIPVFVGCMFLLFDILFLQLFCFHHYLLSNVVHHQTHTHPPTHTRYSFHTFIRPPCGRNLTLASHVILAIYLSKLCTGDANQLYCIQTTPPLYINGILLFCWMKLASVSYAILICSVAIFVYL